MWWDLIEHNTITFDLFLDTLKMVSTLNIIEFLRKTGGILSHLLIPTKSFT